MFIVVMLLSVGFPERFSVRIQITCLPLCPSSQRWIPLSQAEVNRLLFGFMYHSLNALGSPCWFSACFLCGLAPDRRRKGMKPFGSGREVILYLAAKAAGHTIKTYPGTGVGDLC